ncbi:MAG: branched-chain amino acid ABC transporter ATP-binding protein/permease [Herpetosiphon sp.]
MQRRTIQLVTASVAAIAALLLPAILRTSDINHLVLGMIYAIAVLGLYFVLGLTGQMNLAQAAFWGIGAYSTGIMTTRYHLSPWIGLAVAAALSASFGVLLGIPTLRLGGHYLAMATIGFGVIVGLILLNASGLTGGADGVRSIPVFQLGGYRFIRLQSYYYLVLVWLVALGAAAQRLRTSRVGRGMLAIRENELAAQTMGINTTRFKVLAFALSATYAGIAGVLFAHMPNVRYISPDTFVFGQSVAFLAMLVIGGSDTVLGAIFGAIFLVFLPEWLRFLRQGYLAVYGAGVMLIIVFLPIGVVGLIEQMVRRRLVPPRRPTVPPEIVANVGVPVGTAGSEGTALLELRGLRKWFGGIKAVDGISFLVQPGTIHALIGPNGSGKTTAINVISGLYQPTDGQILFNGVSIGGKRPHHLTSLGLARTYQNIRLFPELSVLENVKVGHHSRSHGNVLTALLPLPGSRAEEQRIELQALAALEFVGMTSRTHDLAKNLAYGQQRRVEIARALAAKPLLLLLDEPAAGLNPTETEELLVLLEKIRSRGTTLLLVEHDMNMVMRLSDHITVLNFGKEIADGTPRAIEHDAAVIEAYLGQEAVLA